MIPMLEKDRRNKKRGDSPRNRPRHGFWERRTMRITLKDRNGPGGGGSAHAVLQVMVRR